MIGSKGWKTIIVNKLKYRCVVLVWYQHECDDVEVMQTVLADGYGKCMYFRK